MPIECTKLRHCREPFMVCPACGRPFRSFMRGQVQKMGWSLLWERFLAWYHRRPISYCALICTACKKLVGHEPCSL